MAITNNKFTGRAMLLQIETATAGTYETLGGIRTKSLSINNEAIDISDGDDGVWKKLLEGGVRSVALSGNGLVSNNAMFERLQDRVIAGSLTKFKLTFGDGDAATGLFHISSLEVNGEYNGAQQFSVSMESADEIAFVVA